MKSRGWKRLWIPSYYCQDVVSSILSTGIEVKAYFDGPGIEICYLKNINEIVRGDVLLRVNFFGLRDCPSKERIGINGMEIIDDHTHDPWSDWAWGTDADWCIASLRKVLPVPDGGIVWSPPGYDLPVAANLSHRHYVASLEKYSSMFIKAMYLDGRFSNKDVFRRLSISSEQNISIRSDDVSGISEWTLNILESFPIKKWRERRNLNHKILLSSLDNVNWLTVLKTVEGSNCCPFSGIIVFDSSARRTYINDKLIENNVYPAILWRLNNTLIQNIPEEHKDLSRRILSIHCDMRYEERDMKKVARMIRKFGKEFEYIRHH